MNIKIYNELREDGLNQETDVLILKTALASTGDYSVPEYGITGYADREMFKAVKNFQERNDLKVDGVVKPQGETLSALNGEINNLKNFDPVPFVKSPIMRCPTCGAPHGGSAGDECPDCASK